MKKRFFKKGFTLIELLVVISVIGILAALSLVSYTTSQKQAKDARRKSDLKQYQTALENTANINNSFYPSRVSPTDITTLCEILDVSGNCPGDPKEGFVYYYLSDDVSGGLELAALDYVLWAQMESVEGYWVVCSTGKNGISETPPSDYHCPI